MIGDVTMTTMETIVSTRAEDQISMGATIGTMIGTTTMISTIKDTTDTLMIAAGTVMDTTIVATNPEEVTGGMRQEFLLPAITTDTEVQLLPTPIVSQSPQNSSFLFNGMFNEF